MILSSSCCEVSEEGWVEVLPLLGIVPIDGGTGEILVGKLLVLEDSLGGKFRS